VNKDNQKTINYNNYENLNEMLENDKILKK